MKNKKCIFKISACNRDVRFNSHNLAPIVTGV